ncbi:hypothetical protein NQ317_010977 [Molorchus minor]|uniref:Uncharacterized protein n=1 Tax=Molorchus minor TaxID=1323400 RepID=A0ABQ9K359_9CUCU|nr:hypothetical protein NQ317_010977 [Molorchus minor]
MLLPPDSSYRKAIGNCSIDREFFALLDERGRLTMDDWIKFCYCPIDGGICNRSGGTFKNDYCVWSFSQGCPEFSGHQFYSAYCLIKNKTKSPTNMAPETCPKEAPPFKSASLIMLFRHGERSPTETYPNDPYKEYKWSGGWGHLTNRGKLQMYDLGLRLKEEYKDYLPGFYWYEDVNITSSYADRCLMSAELVCAALFPPKGYQVWNPELLWQPVPVKYLPRSQDTSIAMKVKCDKYDKMFNDVMNSSKVQNILSENKELIKYLSENTGTEMDTIGKIELLFNTLEIEMLNNLTLPHWVNDTIMQTMKRLGAQNLALYSETPFMKRIKGGVLLGNIIASMESALQGKNVPSLFLYSGHDLTIVHVLRSLNLVDTIKPNFGATLIFELHSHGEVKIAYRNSWDEVAEEKLIDSCKSPCQLSGWKTYLDPVLPTNWQEECKM